MPGPDLFDTLLRVHGAETLGREYVFVRLARMNIAGHLDYSEISRILQKIRRRADWLDVWMAASERHRSLAAAAAYRGAFTSAGDSYLRASLCAHWASLYAPEHEKSAAHQTSLQLYAAGAEWFEPPVHRIEIPFDGDILAGYVRRPGPGTTQPAVIMLGGAWAAIWRSTRRFVTSESRRSSPTEASVMRRRSTPGHPAFSGPSRLVSDSRMSRRSGDTSRSISI
jgi:hypothetical protein